MKKPISIFIFLCLLLCLFVSCSDHEANKPPETENNQIETEQNLPETETDAPETAPVVLELTAAEEEEITALFNRMIEYDRIYVSTDRIMGSGEIEKYNRVADERFDTWEEWTAFVESIYCGDALDQINKKIENDAIFVNIDGYTYVVATVFFDFLSDDFTMSIEDRTNDTVTVKLIRIKNVPHLGIVNEMYNIYTLQKTDAGWRIADSLSEYFHYTDRTG